MYIDSYRQHSFQKMAPLGSDLYYALRFAKPDYPERIVLLLELEEILSNIPFQIEDNTVALRTLFWWKDEVAMISVKMPNHPTVQALHKMAVKKILLPNSSYLESLVVEMMKRLSRPIDETFEHWLEEYQQAPSIMQWLIHLAPEQEIAALKEITCFIKLSRNIRHIHLKRARGLHELTFADAQKYGLSLDTLTPHSALVSLLNTQYRRANTYFDAGMKQAVKSSIGKWFKILGQLEKNTLEKVHLSNYPTTSHNLSLTPIRKCWIAYKLS